MLRRAGTDLLLLLFHTRRGLTGAAGRLPAFHFPGRERLRVLPRGSLPAEVHSRPRLPVLYAALTSLTHPGWVGETSEGGGTEGGGPGPSPRAREEASPGRR